jgi:hypothetical protein
MPAESRTLTREEIHQRAQAWFAREMDAAQKAQGAAWPQHQEWVADYLRQEIRQRLQAIGWRPKK